MNILPKHHAYLDLLQCIDNQFPELALEMTHKVYLPILCPKSQNPKAGSFITISYIAGTQLLEIFSLEKYIHAFIGNDIVRDIEYFTQVVGQNIQQKLQCNVQINGEIHFNGLNQALLLNLQLKIPKSLTDQAIL